MEAITGRSQMLRRRVYNATGLNEVFDDQKKTVMLKSSPEKTVSSLSPLAVKQGRVVKLNDSGNWRERHALLVPHTFLYYFSPDRASMELQPHGVIDLEHYTNITVVDDDVVRIAPRDDSLPIRTFHIRLHGNKEAQAWAKALRDTRFGPTREERDALVNVRAILTEQVETLTESLRLCNEALESSQRRESSTQAELAHIQASEAQKAEQIRALHAACLSAQGGHRAATDHTALGGGDVSELAALGQLMEEQARDILALQEANASLKSDAETTTELRRRERDEAASRLNEERERLASEIAHRKRLEQEIQQLRRTLDGATAEAQEARANLEVVATACREAESKSRELQDHRRVLVREIKMSRVESRRLSTALDCATAALATKAAASTGTHADVLERPTPTRTRSEASGAAHFSLALRHVTGAIGDVSGDCRGAGYAACTPTCEHKYEPTRRVEDRATSDPLWFGTDAYDVFSDCADDAGAAAADTDGADFADAGMRKSLLPDHDILSDGITARATSWEDSSGAFGQSEQNSPAWPWETTVSPSSDAIYEQFEDTTDAQRPPVWSAEGLAGDRDRDPPDDAKSLNIPRSSSKAPGVAGRASPSTCNESDFKFPTLSFAVGASSGARRARRPLLGSLDVDDEAATNTVGVDRATEERPPPWQWRQERDEGERGASSVTVGRCASPGDCSSSLSHADAARDTGDGIGNRDRNELSTPEHINAIDSDAASSTWVDRTAALATTPSTIGGWYPGSDAASQLVTTPVAGDDVRVATSGTATSKAGETQPCVANTVAPQLSRSVAAASMGWRSTAAAECSNSPRSPSFSTCDGGKGSLCELAAPPVPLESKIADGTWSDDANGLKSAAAAAAIAAAERGSRASAEAAAAARRWEARLKGSFKSMTIGSVRWGMS